MHRQMQVTQSTRDQSDSAGFNAFEIFFGSLDHVAPRSLERTRCSAYSLPAVQRRAGRAPYATSSQSRRTSGAPRRSSGVPSNTIWPWPIT